MAKIKSSELKSFFLQRPSLKYVMVSQVHNRPSHGFTHFPLGMVSVLIGALIIFTLSIRDNKAVQHLNSLLLDLTFPLIDGITQPFSALDSWSDTFRTNKSLREEVAFLREENEHFQFMIQDLRQQTRDQHQLQLLTNALPDTQIERLTARVVGHVSDGMNTQLTIKASEENGILKGQPVITADGVLGRISEVGGLSSSNARVMLLTDLSSRIPVEIESTHDHGIISGQNGPELRLIHLEKSVKVKVGDRLLTSGYGGIFPPGLPVAIVTQVTDDTIIARPFVKETPTFVTVLFGL
ncbi:MAG: rod shape-determining protein MreC [Alphaproteobacteria bacterium]|nr:rod shape-determining protein MreC [Alphaproteobacteria bacterium]